MVESEDKGIELMTPTEFDENDPVNPKYVDKKEEILVNESLEIEKLRQNITRCTKKQLIISAISGIIIAGSALLGLKYFPVSYGESIVKGSLTMAVLVPATVEIYFHIKRHKVMQLMNYVVNDTNNQIKRLEKEEKELGLSKSIKTTNISKTHDRLTNDEYVNGLKKYVDDIVELSKINPELAKESALQALINTGVLDENGNEKDTIVKSYVDDKQLSKPFVKKLKTNKDENQQ